MGEPELTMKKYAIGIDFGTLSGRALLADVQTGEALAVSVFPYPNGVMSEALPSGTPLGIDWALEHPQDYLDVLTNTIPEVLRASGVAPADVVGVGIDFTGCTPMPVLADGTPLCFLPEYSDEPHAYVKLWKHHAAQPYANQLNEVARARGEVWLPRYGGKISSEWLFPKIWQILDEAPDVYARMDHFIEAGDWVVWQMTGVPSRNACLTGYKAIWNRKEGYPSSDFFKALDPRLENVVAQKLSIPVREQGQRIGGITPEMAACTGLCPGTPVATAHSDAMVNMPGVKINRAGQMLAIMGTSTCHLLLGEADLPVPGICGCVENGIIPGFYGYEAGQSCVGDHFGWFVNHCVPPAYFEAARAQNQNIHAYLQTLAARQKPGQSGLIALDWWNGNRSVLVDADLTGLMLGMTLRTKPEDMYRALVEATAFGTRLIIENYTAHGVPVDEVFATGGITDKSPFVMQVYADILQKPIYLSGCAQGPALGAAMFGALAAGVAGGGYDDLSQASENMGRVKDTPYAPNPANAPVYDQLFAAFKELHDHFGRGGSDIMKRLKAIQARQQEG